MKAYNQIIPYAKIEAKANKLPFSDLSGIIRGQYYLKEIIGIPVATWVFQFLTPLSSSKMGTGRQCVSNKASVSLRLFSMSSPAVMLIIQPEWYFKMLPSG